MESRNSCDLTVRVLLGEVVAISNFSGAVCGTVPKAKVLQNGFVLRFYLWYLLCKNLPSTHSVTTPTKAIQ